jgi:hypothetical protein
VTARLRGNYKDERKTANGREVKPGGAGNLQKITKGTKTEISYRR